MVDDVGKSDPELGIVGQMPRLTSTPHVVAFSPDSKLAAVSGNGTVAHLLDATTGKSLGLELKHAASVRSLSFSPIWR
jgi:WD40 repeat protein